MKITSHMYQDINTFINVLSQQLQLFYIKTWVIFSVISMI